VALFDAPIETKYSEDMQPLERMLLDLARRASVLILWLDCDREGEAISDEVRSVCLRGNARLGSQSRIFRAKFSTVMPGEIQRALRSLGRVNENLVKAVEARSEHDLRECYNCSLLSYFSHPHHKLVDFSGVGAAFTRFMTCRFRHKFDGFAGWSCNEVFTSHAEQRLKLNLTSHHGLSLAATLCAQTRLFRMGHVSFPLWAL